MPDVRASSVPSLRIPRDFGTRRVNPPGAKDEISASEMLLEMSPSNIRAGPETFRSWSPQGRMELGAPGHVKRGKDIGEGEK